MRYYIGYLIEYYYSSGLVGFFLFILSFVLTLLIVLKYKFFRKIEGFISENKSEGSPVQLPAYPARGYERIDKNLKIISNLAAIAPLLGLLGTVTGMISTFEIMTAAGAANISAFADGIKESLFTTEIGLIIAIPGYLFSKRLQKKARLVKLKFENISV
ncbi:MAG TPA: MotA/TolQ/ExbB proton channel family protein [bacterium]|nr:MotA/TolQ/ExbB proton channel family protein [bacterium]HPN32631.1 MotA/TolQ/ExbB proton channel family protein [bacterium]